MVKWQPNGCQQAEALIQRSAGEINQIFNILSSFVWKFCPSTTQFIHASEIVILVTTDEQYAR